MKTSRTSRLVLVARKYLVEILREPQLLLLVLAMPIIFLLITLVMYSTPLQPTYSLWIYDPGAGHAALYEELQSQRYYDGRPVFAITQTASLDEAEAALKDRRAAVLLSLSPDRSDYTIRGDAISTAFYRASIFLESALRDYSDRAAGRSPLVRLVEQPVFAEGGKSGGPQSQYDLYAPGMIVFAILMIIPQTAMLVSRELRWRTLQRLRLTRLNAWELLAGVSLAQMVVALLQVVLIFFAAQALGFHNQGSLGLAILVGLVLSLSAIGPGLIVACFVENDSQAANLGATFAMLQVFLCGAWFAMPPMTIFTLAGHQIDVFDIFPATSGSLALKQVLSYGIGLEGIAFRLGLTLLLSGVYYAIGVLIFQRRQMQHT
ncbi:MAG: ABC transporter permease [Chloroflexota bacterium]